MRFETPLPTNLFAALGAPENNLIQPFIGLGNIKFGPKRGSAEELIHGFGRVRTDFAEYTRSERCLNMRVHSAISARQRSQTGSAKYGASMT